MPEDATSPPEPTIVLTRDGTEHRLSLLDMTPALATDLRVQSGGAWRWTTLVLMAWEHGFFMVGLEEFAPFEFVARRQAGEAVTYVAVAAAISGRSELDARFEGDDEDAQTLVEALEVPDSPPASGE